MQHWAGFFQPYLNEIRGTRVSFLELTFQTLPLRRYLTAGRSTVTVEGKTSVSRTL